MKKLTRGDLLSLEQYAAERVRLRSEVIAHKQLRNVQVGPNMTWCFEDYTTIRYQVLEMLRAERIFESEGIQGEIDAYNPLIPDGSNWKVTLLLEFPDPEVRRAAKIGAGYASAKWSGYLRSPTKTWSVKMRTKPRPCIFFASSSHPRWLRR